MSGRLWNNGRTWSDAHREGDIIGEGTRIDCHIHTVFSGHGTGTVREVVGRALSLRLDTIAFTEHLGMPQGWDPAGEFSMDADTEERYLADVHREQDEQSELDIVCGAEADWLGDPDFIAHAARPYDYLLGSVHFIDGWAFDNPAFIDGWQDRGVDDVWNRYVEIWCEAATSDAPFDTMAHPDLPKKFGDRPVADPTALYARMAEAAREGGRAIEVNTSGFSRPVGEQYPGEELLRAFHHAEVPCTVGSDSHAPAGVFSHIPEALAIMYRAGYRELMVPCGHHGRRSVPLEG